MRYRTCQLKFLEKPGFLGEGKVPAPPLNDFFFFFRKIAIFVRLVITQLDSQSNLKKENTAKVK